MNFFEQLPLELRNVLADHLRLTGEQLSTIGNDAIADGLCDALNLPVVPLTLSAVDRALYFAHRDLWHDLTAVPLFHHDVLVQVACPAPWDMSFHRKLMTVLQRDVRLVGARESELDNLLADLHLAEPPPPRQRDRPLSQSISDSPVEFRRGSIVSAFKELVLRCSALGASDIHVSPFPDRVAIRARIRGDLESLPPASPQVAADLIQELKMYAGIPVDEPAKFHDGKASLAIEGEQPLELRAMSGPTPNGEAFVFRILDPNKLKPHLGKLPFPGKAGDVFKSHLERGDGLILVTGPTGSGKTTTLYCALSCVDRYRLSIQTVEQPVEYKLDLINQYEVPRGATFAEATRYVMRGDPDVVLVGEVRDPDSAATCCELALTGHQVFSTLHATTVVESVARLRELGVPRDILAQTLSLVVAQRLVATLCQACSRPIPTSPQARRHMCARIGSENVPDQLRQRKGCKECLYTGIAGVTPIFEMMEITPTLRDLLAEGTPLDQVRVQWENEGGRPLVAHGLSLVAEGRVDYDEVARYEPDRRLMRAE